MTVFSLVSMTAAVIYVALAVIIIQRNPKASLNWFAGSMLAIWTLWSAGPIIHHLRPLVSYAAAHLAHRIGVIGVYGYPAPWLLFTLALTNRKKYLRSWPIYVIIIGIPLALILNEWFGSGVGSVVNNGSYWGLSLRVSGWSVLALAYQIGATALGLYLVLRFGRRATQARQRRQAMVLFYTGGIPWVTGLLVEWGWSALTHNPSPAIAGMLGLVWAGGLAITVMRFGLTSFTVQAAADKILATVPDALLLLDADGNILTANEATSDVLGYPRQELIGLSAARLFDPPGDFQSLHSRLEREQNLPGVEATVRSHDGREVPVSITARTMPQANGSVGGSVWVLHDITVIRQVQELQAQMTRELAAANKELNDFAHVVSHDLKAPLRAIDALAAWLGESCFDKLNAAEREQFGLIRARVQRMHDLIEGVLQYSRAGGVREEQVEVNLSEVLPRVIDILSPPVHIKVQIETPLPTISAEPTRIQQVFQNLLSNAVKFNDKSAGLIRVGSIDDGEYWRFYVADNGPGIEQKDFERIFKIFETGRPRGQVESTGVGLAVVKRSVEMYGGRIWVESRVGEGSKFSFTYPKRVPNSGRRAIAASVPGLQT